MIPQNFRLYLLGIAEHSITWDISGILFPVCSCSTITMHSFCPLFFFPMKRNLRIVCYDQTRIFLFCSRILTHGFIFLLKKITGTGVED